MFVDVFTHFKTLVNNFELCYNYVNIDILGRLSMDFFEIANQNLSKLNNNERILFEYVVQNIHSVQDMSIRTFAENCYVSTTTIIRFVRKLGFDGYRHFTNVLRVTCHSMDEHVIPGILEKNTYSEEYLKNIIESVRVLTQKDINLFISCLQKDVTIYFLGCGLSKVTAYYAYYIFTVMAYKTYLPQQSFEIDSMLKNIQDNDVIFVFSISGDSPEIINIIERAHMKCKPIVASITWSGNNLLQNLTDIDFYVFSDQVKYNNTDITSRISMIAIVELIAYNLISTLK